MAATIYVINGSLNSDCDCTLKAGQYPAGTVTDITLTVKESYRKTYVFNPDSPPYIEYRSNNKVIFNEPFVIQDDYTCTLHTNLDAGGNAPASGLVMTRVEGILLNVENAPKCNLTLDNYGYTSSLPVGSYRMGVQYNITLTRKNPYWVFDTAAPPVIRYIRYGDRLSEENFSIVDDDTCTLDTKLNPFPELPEEGYSLEGRICEGCNFVNFGINADGLIACVSNFPTGYYKAGSVELIVSCDPSYEFDELPTLVQPNGMTNLEYEFVKENAYTYKLQIKLSAGVTYTLYGAAKKKTAIGDKYGFILAYRLTVDEVMSVSQRRWLEVTQQAEKFKDITVFYSNNEQYIDTAKFVVRFFKLYCPIETTVKQRLMFGKYDMGIDCDLIEEEIITMDCGTVQLTGKYQNNLDYTSTTLDLYLPFIGFVSLPPSDFMDKEIKITYQVNVLNGEGLAIVYANGEPIQTHTCSLALEIPFKLGGDEEVNTALAPNSNYLLNTPPFLQVKSQKAVDTGPAAPYRDTKFYSRFGLLNGYTEATEIDMTILPEHTFITKTEIDEIVSLLESGVFL